MKTLSLYEVPLLQSCAINVRVHNMKAHFSCQGMKKGWGGGYFWRRGRAEWGRSFFVFCILERQNV